MPNPKAWRQFEIAVANLITAFDQKAKVIHDYRHPDRHTNRSRQRDVWIETMALGHFPVSMLVSCKRYGRKLHQGDIEHFNGELIDSGARVGIVYSYSGFHHTAITKAKAKGIHCCRLFENATAEIPELFFFETYCSFPQFGLVLPQALPSEYTLSTWNDLFSAPVVLGDRLTTVLDQMIEIFHKHEEIASRGKAKCLPRQWLVQSHSFNI